jgi:hypothetical protein
VRAWSVEALGGRAWTANEFTLPDRPGPILGRPTNARNSHVRYSQNVKPSPTNPQRDPSPGVVSGTLESLAAAILCIAIIAGPLALGGTLGWACFGLEAAMVAAAILWAVARPRPVMSLLIPLVIAGLVLLQIVPLPDWLLSAIAPVSAGRWKVVHEGMPEAWGRVSITPAASAAAARRLLLGVATILVVADLSREPRRRRWFFTALATAGGLVWLLAAVVPVDPDNRSVYGVFSLRGPIEFWKMPLRQPMQTAGVAHLDWVTVGNQRYQADGALPGTGVGPYIYANHFANALCLTMPAVCAIWLVYARKLLPRPAAFIGILTIMGAAVWGSVAWADSRAGTAALLFGSVVYLSLIVESRWRRWLLGGVAAAGLVALLGFMAVFQGPLAGLAAWAPADWRPFIARAMQDGRMVAARTAGRMFLASPLLGTGLGSYGDLYGRLVGGDIVMYFAHNDHAQLWAEAGIVGILVTTAAAAVLLYRFVRFCRERRPGSRAIDAAAWAALAAGAAHSVFDWNMHAPANAFLACMLVGLALSSVVPQAATAPAREWAWGSRLTTAGFAVAALCATLLLARDARLDSPLAELRRAISVARLAKSPADHAATVERLTAAIAIGEDARDWAPRDWPLPMLLGQARLHLEHAAKQAEAAGQIDLPAGRTTTEWFREAMLASPGYRGLPEPVVAK